MRAKGRWGEAVFIEPAIALRARGPIVQELQAKSILRQDPAPEALWTGWASSASGSKLMGLPGATGPPRRRGAR